MWTKELLLSLNPFWELLGGENVGQPGERGDRDDSTSLSPSPDSYFGEIAVPQISPIAHTSVARLQLALHISSPSSSPVS